MSSLEARTKDSRRFDSFSYPGLCDLSLFCEDGTLRQGKANAFISTHQLSTDATALLDYNITDDSLTGEKINLPPEVLEKHRIDSVYLSPHF